MAGISSSADAATPPPPPQLGLVALGQPHGYFALTMKAGSTRHVQVELINPGTVSATARTYTANTYTLSGGGFGARTSTDPLTGTSTWVTYPLTTTTLAPGAHLTQTVTVNIPPATPPGQYVSSLVAESGAITPADITSGATQILRTAIAVSIQIPGPLHPHLTVGKISHVRNAGITVLTLPLSNTGTARLTPTLRLAVSDSSGTVVASRAVTMGSFYAHTTSSMQATLPNSLPPGRYTATLRLTDPRAHLAAVTVTTPVTIPGTVKAKPIDVTLSVLTVLGIELMGLLTIASIKQRNIRRLAGARSEQATTKNPTAI